jgi:erythromycin esterase
LLLSLATSSVAAGARVQGRVRDPSAKPVCGTWVALVREKPGADEESTRPAAVTRVACDGLFSVGPVPPGTYSLSASLPGRAAGFRDGIVVETTAAPSELNLDLSEAVRTFSGTIRSQQDQPIAGAQVRAHRWSDDRGAVFCTQAGSEGAYALTVPSEGAYFLLAVARGYRPAHPDTQHPQASGTKDFTVDFELRSFGGAPRQVVDWIRSHGVELKTVEAGQGFEDLLPLRTMIRDARVVGLGEATHGTRESTQLKHRLFEFLASAVGFTAFAVEGRMTAGFDLNAYVLSGTGNPVETLWAFAPNEETLDLVRWMRAYNAEVSHLRKLKIYGIDMLGPAPAARMMLAYLGRVDPEAAALTERSLGVLVDPKTQFGGCDTSRGCELAPAAQAKLRGDIKDLLKRFDERQNQYVAKSSDSEWAIAQQFAVLVAQNVAIQTSGEGEFEARDRGMAQNVRWILDREGPDAKIVVSAHNGHVALDRADRMGAFLRETYGSGYLSVGFAFNQGGFRANEFAFGRSGPPRDFYLGPAPRGSLDETLAEAGLGIAALDLRAAPRVGPVSDWFGRSQGSRNIGAGFHERFAGAFLQPHVLRHTYDVLLFVNRTTAAHPLPSP